MKLYKPVELQTYITRSTSGPGKVAGDFGFTRSPADWTYIESEKTAFVANPTAARWTGPRTSVLPIPPATTFEYGTGKDAIDKTKLILLHSAALWALVKNDTTVKNLVKTELLWFAAQPKLQMSNPNIWSLNSGHSDGFYMFEISISTINLLYAYDYVEEVFTSAEQATMQAWFKGIADFMRDQFTRDLNSKFVSRTVPIEQYVYKEGSTPTVRATSGGSEGGVAIQPWDTWPLARHYNNRKSHMAALSALYGAKYGSQSHMDEAKKFSREVIAFMVRGDGVFAELERSDDDSIPSKGLNYALTTITSLLQIADACARTGDYSMYNFKTKFGLGGSASTVDKGIEWMILEWGKYLNGTKKVYSRGGVVGDENYRIDGVQSNWILCGQVSHFTLASLYYKNPAIKSIYTMDTTKGYYSIPTANIASNGQLQYYQSMVGFGHGLFKFGGFEAIDVYAPVPVAPAAPASINLTSVTTSGFTVNWSIVQGAASYRLDVSSTSDFSSFVGGYQNITVSGVSQVVTGLNDNIVYYVRMRAVNAVGTSGNSIVINTRTIDIPDVDPTPINPNLVLRKEIEGNYTVVTDTDGDIGENVDVNRSGGKDVKIWDVGDKISIAWNVPLNRYSIKFKARCGNSTNKTAHRASYRVAINGLVQPYTLDEFSIGPLESGYGGSYWGIFVLDKVVSLSSGSNTITIEALAAFQGVDYIEFYKLEDNTVTKYTNDQLVGIAKIQGTTPVNTHDDFYNQVKTQTVPVTVSSQSIALQTQVGSTVEGTIKGLSSTTTPTPPTTPIVPEFTLTIPTNVSIGVYLPDGTKIRSLFENLAHNAGTHQIYWDGKDEAGVAVANGSYQFNVTTGNVSGDWEGVIGNNSVDSSGQYVWRGFDRLYDFTILGNYGYAGIGYNEGQTSHVKWLLTDSHRRLKILPASGADANMEVRKVTNDGTNIFWAGVDPFSGNKNLSFIMATKATDDTQYTFSSGASYKCIRGRTYSSVIGKLDQAGSDITGLAVQKTGNFLFASRKGIGGGTLYVFHRGTGAAVQTISIAGVDKLAVDSSDNLWVHSGATVTKYIVNSDGTVSSTGVTIAGLSSPQGLGCKNTEVFVLDGGVSQQIKRFSTSGAAIETIGQAGGYATNSLVYDDKFFFNDGAAKVSGSAIGFLPSGNYMVLDTGNNRIQMYNSSNVWTDRIVFLPKCWSCVVDKTNPTRVFADFWEFAVDYTKSLGANNGSWTLKNNWGYNVPANKDDIQKRLQFLTTIQGRTFACQPVGSTWEIVELKANGTMIFTGRTFARDFVQMYPDGSLRRFNAILTGSNTPTWYIKACTGLDAIGPVWGPETIVATAPAKTNLDPVPYGNKLVSMTMGEITTSNILVSFDGHIPIYGSAGDHIGGIKVGTNKWLWRGAPSTHVGYTGIYPKNGAYDLGNSVQYAGTKAVVQDNYILWGYHGEFWKGGQVNKYNVLTDKGLMVGQFGTTTWDVSHLGEAAPQMAGNAFHPNFVKYNGEYYLYHNDESFHGGIHRWKLTGLPLVREQFINYTLDSTKPLVNPEKGIDLLIGLPGLATPLATGNGWTVNAAGFIDSGFFGNYYGVKSGVKTHGREKDIWWWLFSPTARTEYITRDLGTNSGLLSYSLNMQVSFEDTMPNNGSNVQSQATTDGGQYLELLDASGKIIARWFHSESFGGSFPISVWGGNQLLGTDSETNMKLITWRPANLTVSVDSTGVRYKYANFTEKTAPLIDPTADRTSPKTFRVVVFKNTGTTYARTGSVANLKLYK